MADVPTTATSSALSLYGRYTADDIIKLTNTEIYNAVEQIGAAQKESARSALFEQIYLWVTSDGQTLFEYHADAVLSSGVVSKVPLSQLWNRRNEQEKAFWAKNADKLKTGLGNEMMNSLAHFQLGTFSNRTAMYAERIKACIQAEADEASRDAMEEALSALDLNDLSNMAPKTAFQCNELPVAPSEPNLILTKKILGGPLPSDFRSAIPDILKGIQSLLDEDDELVTNGRIDSVRIDYNTIASGIHSITSRLDTACTRGGFVPNTKYDDTDPWVTCEWLLRPLVYWNRRKFYTKFPGLPKHPRDHPSERVLPNKELWSYRPEDDHSRLKWLSEEDSLQELFPGDWSERAAEIVSYLVEEFRQHVATLCYDTLPHKAKTLIKELFNNDQVDHPVKKTRTLAERLEQCFDRRGLQPVEYLDMIEQQFWWMHWYLSRTKKEDPLKLAGSYEQSTSEVVCVD